MAETTRHLIDKIAWIFIADGRILSTRSRGKRVYYLPGGKREEGETDLDALTREISEELSVDLRVSSARFLGEFRAQADSHPDGVIVQMRCYECDYSGNLEPAAEIEQMVWLDYDGRYQSSPVDQIIFDWLRTQGKL